MLKEIQTSLAEYDAAKATDNVMEWGVHLADIQEDAVESIRHLLEIISQQSAEITRLNEAYTGFISDWTSAEIEHGEKVRGLEVEITRLRKFLTDFRQRTPYGRYKEQITEILREVLHVNP